MAAKVVPIITARDAKLLWDNSRDSILHALKHFAELSQRNGDEFHHKKWIVVSVHHAAEAFCSMLLKQFDPGNAIYKKRGQDHWPSLVPAVNELLKPQYRSRLRNAEIRLLDLLKRLNGSRNHVMHGIVPKDLDVSLSAMSILGLSRVAHRRRGKSVKDILQQDPPIQSDVVAAISYKKVEDYSFEDYSRFVEAFLAEEFPGEYFPECENCGASSIVNRRCEACFEPMECFTCDSCDLEILLPESRRVQGETEVICSSCGKKISA